MLRPGMNHVEALCLMKYAAVKIEVDGFKQGRVTVGTATEIEWIWNSRDGVTPFIIQAFTGAEMKHVDWHEDAFLPNYVPLVGSRAFVGAPSEPELITITEEMRNEFRRLAIEDPYTVDKGVIVRRSTVKRI